MGNNPFSITSDDLVKRQQGIQGTGAPDGSVNTKEAREAKETEELKSTDVHTAASARGGSMATTDGTFENYDGFTRTTTETYKELEECEDATSNAKDAQSGAKGATNNANQASETAEEDQKLLQQLNKTTKSKEKATISTTNKNNNEIETIKGENDILEEEANDINDEIELLMAEDGETYSAEDVTADDEAPPAAPAPAPAENGQNAGITPQSDGTSAGGVDVTIGANNGAGSTDSPNVFAMNSLPADGGAAQPIPTSETAVGAQNSSTKPPNNGGQGQQGPASRSAASASGSSLGAFGTSLATPKGKNADKIQELQSQVASTTASIQTNTNKIGSLRSTNNNLFSTSLANFNKVKSTASTKKDNNKSGFNVAQATQLTGAATTTTGGVITGIASLKMSSALPPVQAAGLALMPWGIGTTAAGGVATTAGTLAAGNTTEGINQAGSTFSSTTSSIANLKNAQKTSA